MDNNPLALYAYAERRGIEVDWVSMRRASSLSVPLPNNTCCIAIDPWKMSTVEQETVNMAHELGHCETGSFYNPYAKLDVRQRHEHRADKWAIEHLISVDELDQAVADGYGTFWELAEHFGVTEEFMRKTVCWYTHGNLAVDLYKY